jgi:hypothetical protein
LRGKEGQRLEGIVVVAGAGGGGDGEQGAAEAVADAMHLVAGRDLVDRAERRLDAERAVVLEREVAVVGAGVLPGDDEDGEALGDQVLDQRVLRREVENVVFHDPGRHDQHRLRPHLSGRRRVLDELDQLVAEHDLAGRHRQVAADLEGLRPGGRPPVDRALPVLDEVPEAAHQVEAARG